MKQGKHLSMIRGFHLADWFTLGNASCGVGALFAVMSYVQSQDVLHLLFACALILLAFILDVFDGRVARWRQQTSLLGRELDSLADVISFGVAPAIIAHGAGMDGLWDRVILIYFVACGVSRLARFNITAEALAQGSEKVKYFEGTPIPSSLLLVIRREWCDRQPSLVWDDPHRSRATPPARVDVRGFRLVNDQQDIAHSETVRSLPPRFTRRHPLVDSTPTTRKDPTPHIYSTIAPANGRNFSLNANVTTPRTIRRRR
jgi:CDP-diacylglycerol--serine O-phosphatidyltransferase